MKESTKNRIKKLDYFLFGWIVKLAYSNYHRPKFTYQLNYKMIFRYVIMQKLLRFNGRVPWPVHFTSVVVGEKKITKGFMCDPGDTPGCYIQGISGIQFGSNIEMGAGVKIISSNHEEGDYTKSKLVTPIIIGDNVWIGSNVVVLPEVKIGNNVIVGAGSVVTKNIPENSIAVGNPCKVIREKKAYIKDIYNIKLNRKYVAVR
jgi:acetyltransferase-like isoleucine patch superfamily enzyme